MEDIVFRSGIEIWRTYPEKDIVQEWNTDLENMSREGYSLQECNTDLENISREGYSFQEWNRDLENISREGYSSGVE